MPKRKATSSSVVSETPAQDRPRSRKRPQTQTEARESHVPMSSRTQMPNEGQPGTPAILTDAQMRAITDAISAGLADRGPQPSPIPVVVTDPPVGDQNGQGNDVFDSICSDFSEVNEHHTGLVPSYSFELGCNVSNKIKVQISSGQYVNLAKLATNFSDPDDETQYFSFKEGNLAMTPKNKVKAITDIQVWTNLFLVYSSIYVTAHPECATALLKYMHTIRLGASRSSGLGWRDYDIQFRLRKGQNPNISFANVDQELWLLYMQPPATPNNYYTKDQGNKCYDFNFRGSCQKRPCFYKHLCMRCSLNHPSIKCSLNLPANRFSFKPTVQQSSGRAYSATATNNARPVQPFRH
ncbi:uncharacterized protein LOC134249974 [Saccostrea cucullata]|uniref:uncharacterized protein LOC134249974 n=1 Tax=Saccostrea cuccullata TaxID=36930 RepID=UPI002ED34FC8